MKVNLKQRNFRVVFARGWGEHYITKYESRMSMRFTSCLIAEQVEPGTEPVNRADGIAWCSPHDNFCKETGRRLALERACANLPPDLRGAILQAYFTRKLRK